MYLDQEKRPVVCRLGRTYKNIVLHYKGYTHAHFVSGLLECLDDLQGRLDNVLLAVAVDGEGHAGKYVGVSDMSDTAWEIQASSITKYHNGIVYV